MIECQFPDSMMNFFPSWSFDETCKFFYCNQLMEFAFHFVNIYWNLLFLLWPTKFVIFFCDWLMKFAPPPMPTTDLIQCFNAMRDSRNLRGGGKSATNWWNSLFFFIINKLCNFFPWPIDKIHSLFCNQLMKFAFFPHCDWLMIFEGFYAASDFSMTYW